MPQDVCPVDGCGRRLSPGHLMCGPHWKLVPAAIAARVWSTLRRWRSERATLGELRAVQGEAIDAVNAAGRP